MSGGKEPLDMHRQSSENDVLTMLLNVMALIMQFVARAIRDPSFHPGEPSYQMFQQSSTM